MKKLLIIEGNTDKDSLNIQKFKGLSYVPLFTKSIEIIGEYQIDALYPTRNDFEQISIKDLQKYDGILWTGSGLSVNETPNLVQPQIQLCKNAFEAKVPMYGSCWGLQIAVGAAGGKVASFEAGYEIGIMKKLTLTKEGKEHYLFKNKTEPISSFCVHKDYIEELPLNSTLLAFNEFCPVQALEINYKGGTFVGVQYHPEFDVKQMLSTFERLEEKLIQSAYFKNNEAYNTEITNMKKEILNKKDFYNNDLYRLLEISNWLKNLEK